MRQEIEPLLPRRHIAYLTREIDDGGRDKTDRDCSNDPYGCIYLSKGLIPERYEKAADDQFWEHDFGFLVGPSLSPVLRRTISPMGISFEKVNFGLSTHLFGYPFDRDPFFMTSEGRLDESPYGDGGYFVACSGLKPGSSGGPWSQTLSSDGQIVLTSVTSWGEGPNKPGSGGPRFDITDAACVYNAAVQEVVNGNEAKSEVVRC